MWLDAGSIRERGSARAIIGEYLARRGCDQERMLALTDLPRPYAADDGRLWLRSLEWLSDLPLRHGEPVEARICFKIGAPVSAVSVGIGFSNLEGARLLSYETDFPAEVRPDLGHPGEYCVDLSIASLPLAPDLYNVDVGARSGDFHGLDYLAACSQIEIIAGPNTPGAIVRKGAGVRLASEWLWNRQRQATDPRPIR